MRRILFPLLVIGLAGGLFTLGSGAFFSDVESDIDNTITAGSLDLSVDTTSPSGCDIAAFVPPLDNDVIFDGGEGDNCDVSVTNNGTLAGDLYLLITITADSDVSCPEPELAAEPGCTGGGDGDLDTELKFSDCTETGSVGDVACSGVVDGTTTLAAIALSCSKVADLAASGSYSLSFDLTSVSVTNVSQTDSITINFFFELVQNDFAGGVDCLP